MSQAAGAARVELHPNNPGFTWQPARGPFRRVTAAQARSYNERGFFLLENAFDAATMAAVMAAIAPFEARGEEYLRRQPGGKMFIAQADGITFTTHLVKRSQVLRDFSAHPVFADLCADLIGPHSRLYWDQAVYKKPEYPKPFPWHQDNGYTYIEPQAYLTCWVALTDATLENGCVWAVSGGHLHGTLAHRLTELGYVCRDEDGPEAVAVPAPAGSIVVFSSLTPHRTGPNLTKSVRASYILQYAPDGARLKNTPGVVRIDTQDGALCNAPDRQYFVVKDGKPVPAPALST